ncbi:MAG TPA: CBS domain-containing protein [Planctomycetaceae bacterium]|jgi:CBS domain-containing protein|nr:CBS domain-containing protein [Planctomycetaceae bacterium]
MLVRDVMTRNVECVSPQTTLQDAAQRMRDLDIGPLPVCDGDRLVGVLTDRDIAVRAVADGEDPRWISVEAVMSPDVITCQEDQTVDQAAELMQRHLIRRLLVLNGDHRISGILSLGDLATQQPDIVLAGEALESISEPVHSKVHQKTSGVVHQNQTGAFPG